MKDFWTEEDFPATKWEAPIKPLEYRGKWVYNWFSNFEPTPFWVDDAPFQCGDIMFKSVENFYQACKATNRSDFRDIALASISNSKKIGRKIDIRHDWEQVKYNIMWQGLNAKFLQNPLHRERLILTQGDIVEWNNWGDVIWGAKVSNGFGQNALGVMLMHLRHHIR